MLTHKEFLIQSDRPFTSRLLPNAKGDDEYEQWEVAVAVAAKSVTEPAGHELRVIHIPSGEVVFRTSAES